MSGAGLRDRCVVDGFRYHRQPGSAHTDPNWESSFISLGTCLCLFHVTAVTNYHKVVA